MQLLKHILEFPVSYMKIKYHWYVKKKIDFSYLRWPGVMGSTADLTVVDGKTQEKVFRILHLIKLALRYSEHK